MNESLYWKFKRSFQNAKTISLMQHVWVLWKMWTLILISFCWMCNPSLDIIKTSPIIDFGSRCRNKEWTWKKMDLAILNRQWITWGMVWRRFHWIQSCYLITLIPMRDLANIILQSSFSGLHNRFERIGVMHIMEKLSRILNNKNLNRLQNVPKKPFQHSNWDLRMKKKLRNYKYNIRH